MKHNYHSHTVYCRHSTFTVEGLVLKAISSGFETFGISEHMANPGGENALWRLESQEKMTEYLNEVKLMKEKYKDEIRILAGLECEITHTRTNEDLSWYMKELIARDDVDYLILGHHTYNEGKHVYATLPSREELEEYVERFKIALDLNIFSQVAHPDGMFRGFGKMTKDLEWAANEMTSYAAKKNMPLGINVNGLKENDKDTFQYPNIEFWKIAAKNGATGIIELDAHEEKVFDNVYINKAKELIKKTGVKTIRILDI